MPLGSWKRPAFVRAWEPINGWRVSPNGPSNLSVFDLLARVPTQLAFGIEVLVACIPGRHVSICYHLKMTENVPFTAYIRKTEVVPFQMAKYIFGMLPGLVAVTEAADVAKGAQFIGRFEEGSISLPHPNLKLLGLYPRIHEPKNQRF